MIFIPCVEVGGGGGGGGLYKQTLKVLELYTHKFKGRENTCKYWIFMNNYL